MLSLLATLLLAAPQEDPDKVVDPPTDEEKITVTTNDDKSEGGINLFTISASLLYPLNDVYGADRDLGFGGALSHWAEFGYLAIQPRVALHVGPGKNGAFYVDSSLGLGALVLPLPDSFVTPIVGGGLALEYLYVRGQTELVEVGSVITTSYERTPSRGGFGLELFARAGAMFFTDSPVRLQATIDYSLIFMFGRNDRAHGLVFSLGLST